MGDRVLSVKVTGESSGLVAALTESQAAIKKLGSEAQTSVGGSKAEFSSLLQAIEKTDPALAGLAQSAAAAGLALDKVGDAKGISAYTTKLVEAQTKVDQYAERLAAAERAGVELGEKPIAALEKMRAGVEKLAEHLVNLRDTSEASQAKIAALTDGGEKGMSDLAKAADAARQATEELSSVKGPEQLEGALKKGAWASLQLKDELARAAAAGEKIDDATVAALKAVEAQTQSSIDKMSRFRKEMADAGEVSKLGADKLDAAKNAAGGLGNVFDKLEKSTNTTASSIGKVGVSLGVAGAAITGAIAAGKELADGIDKLSEKYAKLQQKQIDQKLALQQQEIALRAADRGLIEHGKTIADTVANYHRYAASQGKLSEGARKFIEDVAGLKIPPTYEDLAKQVDGIKIAFEGAYKKGEDFGNRMLVENEQALASLAQKYKDVGQAVPEEIQKLIDKLNALKAAGEAAAGGVGETISALAALKGALDNIGKMPAGAAGAGGVIDQIADGIGKAKAAGDEWKPTLDANQAKLEELYGQANKEGYEALDNLRKNVMDQVPAWQAAKMVNEEYGKALDNTASKLNEFGRNQRDQDVWDQNTQDINASKAALDAQNFALQEGFDAWATAGQAMGPFSIEVRKATEGYVATGNAAVDLIERLAQANDKMGDLALFAGSWIAELEKGNISAGEFRKKLDELSTGLPTYAAILRAAGVDVKDTTQSIIGMYQALNDVTFMESTVTFWERMGIAMGKAFRVPRDEAEKLREELERVEIVAGLVNEAISGPRGAGISLEDVIKELNKPGNGGRG